MIRFPFAISNEITTIDTPWGGVMSADTTSYEKYRCENDSNWQLPHFFQKKYINEQKAKRHFFGAKKRHLQ
jgi:hypothetical protein